MAGNAHRESLKRVLGQMGGLARELKTSHLKSKFGPIPKSDPAAETAPGEEGSAVEEAGESPTEEAMEQKSGMEKSELMALSPEKIKALLASLKK